VYCDLDQVLVNFLGGAKRLFGKEFNDPLLGSNDDKWVRIASHPGFWSELPWMPRGRVLWDRLVPYNPFILSACPPAELNPTCSTEKREWCTIQLEIASERVYTVNRADKQSYAFTDSQPNLLIDDHPHNVAEWRAAGGIAVHHQSITETLQELSRLGF
jgi:5'-nucleotidase